MKPLFMFKMNDAGVDWSVQITLRWWLTLISTHMHIQKCNCMLTCTQKHIVNTHTLKYESFMTAGTEGWLHAGRGGGVPLSVVELMDREHGTHEAQGLGRDVFRCDFIGGLLSHSHSDERKEQKRGRRWDENIATVVKKWRTRRQNRGEKCLWMAKREEATWWIHMNIAWFEHRRTAEWMVWRGTIQEDVVQLMTLNG